ncbi:MAG: branched-chain amino acid ABC transporter permease [Lautropia sp.]
MNDPVLILQLVLNGVLLAGVYASMAMGLNLIFGVIRVLNFAHGEVLMIGAFCAFWAWRLAGLNPVASFLISGPLLFACGYLFQYFVVRRIANRRMAIEDASLLLTYGLSLVLVALARLFWSADYRSVPFLQGSWLVGEMIFPISRTFAFGCALAVTILLVGMLHWTRIGLAIRATAQNRELASACGVLDRHVHAVAFGIGTTLAGLSGMLLSTMYAVYPDMGMEYSIRAFVIVILGGLGSMTGAFVGALILGIVESVGSFYLGALPATLIPFLAILAILFLRPAGLAGARAREG